MFRKIISFLGTKIRNPLVGFGVVGIKTLVKLSLIFGDIDFVVSFVANPTSGFLILVPKKDLVFLNMNFEDAMKFIISVGAVGELK